MKLALIPPTHWTSYLDRRDYHLVLPHQLLSETFGEVLRLTKGYKILDNGVAEHWPLPAAKLLEMAGRHNVNEIILPDVIANLRSTYASLQAFLGFVRRSGIDYASKYEFHGVAQGNSYDQVHECIRQYRRHGITTIGVPRHLCTTIDREARYRLVQQWRHNPGLDNGPIAFHLLGTNPAYMREMLHHGKHFRMMGVRGIDTSAPFVYALAGLRIDSGEIVSRQEGYLQTPALYLTPKVHELVDTNIEILEGWINQ